MASMTPRHNLIRYGIGEAAEAPVTEAVEVIGEVMGTLYATIDVSDEVTLDKTKSEWRLSTAFCSVRDQCCCSCLPNCVLARVERVRCVAPISSNRTLSTAANMLRVDAQQEFRQMYGRKEWQALASAAQSLMCVAQTAAAAHDIEGCVDVLALAQKYACLHSPINYDVSRVGMGTVQFSQTLRC
jgi:hypothetical protein